MNGGAGEVSFGLQIQPATESLLASDSLLLASGSLFLNPVLFRSGREISFNKTVAFYNHEHPLVSPQFIHL